MATRKTARPKIAAADAPRGTAPANPPASNGLGARLREARERSGATVRGLARAVGVSPSLVSQIERGKVMPSVGTLYALTNEMGLLVDDVFKDDPQHPAAVAGAAAGGGRSPRAAEARAASPVQHHETRRAIRLASGVRWELLTAAPDDELDFLHVVYDVGSESCAEDSMVRHGGKEFAYLLSGRLGVKIGFKEFELRRGDSISFDAQMPHRLWAIGTRPAAAIWVVLNRQGDRRGRTDAPAARRGPRGKA